MEKVSSPLSAQILEFCESELFPDGDFEGVTSSNSYPVYNDSGTGTTTKAAITTAIDPSEFSLIFEEDVTENDVNSINLDYATTPHLNLLHHQFGDDGRFDLTHNAIINGPMIGPVYSRPNPSDHVVPMIGPALATVCEDEPSKLMRLNQPSSPHCNSFMNPSMNSYLSGSLNRRLSGESSGMFEGNLFMGNEVEGHELDFKGDDGGIFGPDPLPPPYNTNEFQALSNESQHVANGSGSCATPLASEISSLDAETFRANNKLTTEERKEKIHRYMKKRNERNFSKKIKYACRKTLADSRPRVRGRFAKNDEFGENNRTTYNNHEEDTDEDVKSFHVVVKEEEDNSESSDIFAHISGVNSFKCNYPIQSWI